MTSVCSRLVHYKKWADSGLYRIVSENLDRLESPDQFVLLQVLDHMHAVDRIFQHHLHANSGGRFRRLPDLCGAARSKVSCPPPRFGRATRSR